LNLSPRSLFTLVRRQFLQVVATAVLFATATVSAASAQPVTPPADAKAQVDKIFARFNKPDSPGCAVGVGIGPTTVLTAAYGMADLEHNVPITPTSVFEVGSLTKQFTAAAVLLLAQQGKLSLDDPVRRYIPELPDYGQPLTIRHLIHHTSGLRDWLEVVGVAGWPVGTRLYTQAFVLDIASRQRALNYPPGAAYSYTNTGYTLLAILAERVSGKSLPQFTREEIFTPLGMTSTQWRDNFQRIVSNRTIAYTYNSGQKTFETLMPFSNVYGQGGILTTIDDLLKWNQNFTSAKVGGPAFLTAQLQQEKLNDGTPIAYAAGLDLFHWKGLPEVSHSGSNAGYRGWLARYPDQGLSIALLCNTDALNVAELGHEVADVYLASAIRSKPVPPETAADPAQLKAMTGMYRDIADVEAISVEWKDGHLQLDGRRILHPTSNGAFTAGDTGTVVRFEAGNNGAIARLKISSEVGQTYTYERVEPSHPAAADLQQMAGTYVSDEANVTYKAAFENGSLVLHRRPDATVSLTPTYRDAFRSSLGSVRFIRDSSGHVVEMSFATGRMWDLRLRRTD
jgi:CubicO group peptidase (beta-lactamase class C family)